MPLEVTIEVSVGQKKLVHKGVEAYVTFLSLFFKSQESALIDPEMI